MPGPSDDLAEGAATRLHFTCIESGDKALHETCRGWQPVERARLRRRPETLGGEQALAETLGVNVSALAGWLQGTSHLPDALYFTAPDIVANGPFNNKERS